jgi:lysophospholipase L1-like esterase
MPQSGFPWLLARKGHTRDLVVLAGLMNLLYACTYILLFPAGYPATTAVATFGLVALNMGLRFVSSSSERRIVKLAKSRSALVWATVMVAGIVPLGLTELACRLLTDLGVLKYHQGIQTVWRSGHDDWRLATITGDQNREPDPVLLWRPAARKPFNSQRFKGPIAEIPKSSNVLRIMCYGDSLTDGPPKGGWPSWFQALLDQQPPLTGLRFQVINAGVAGYSSHQGLMRFVQEVDRYQPDMLLVSFGWNDAAEAIGQPDKTFKIPPWPMVSCQRTLIQYRAYLVLMYYSRGWRAQPPVADPGSHRPRVSVEDYLANLDRFRAEAQKRGIPLAILTRPHKLPPEQLSQDTTWRGSVPRYNVALVDWARDQEVPVIDAQHFFQQLPNTLFSDECHLTKQGYLRLAIFVRNQLVTNPDGRPPLVWNGRSSPKVSPSSNVRNHRLSLLELSPASP